ncbi:T9SS type A sorting domain-containing protein [Flavobacterium davisii]|uniref:T9SS type A sorting domain-containing protein n=1 Tax=Flavobacterium davisii TaxID=2906077 RepID=UPI0021CF0ADD|nr:T9SS type A sorting domain-containing protein [Flavobacterium davisii]
MNFYYYPNPTTDLLYLETKKKLPIKFSIINLNGKIIIPERTLEKNYIDTRSLNSGIYILLLNQENITTKIKLIKSENGQ